MNPLLPIAARLETLLASAIAATVEGFESSGPIPCWLGMPQPRNGLGSDTCEQIARALQETRNGLALSSMHVLAEGHAAGLMALQAAAQQIAAGEADVCLAAGADSYHDAACRDGWTRRGR